MLYLENHDHPRVLSRYGSEKFRRESGKMLAVSYLFQKGTPFVYQGQELGMINWRPESAEAYEDVQTRYLYAHSLTWLPEKLRLPLVLCYSEGMSYEEAAAALRIPLSTLRGRIHRGRGQLRKELNAE